MFARLPNYNVENYVAENRSSIDNVWTYPLILTGNDGLEPAIIDRNNSTYVNPGGPIFITVGTAGEELYDLAGQLPFVSTQFKRNGFLDVHISNNGTRLTGTFFDSLSESDGDYFTIAKL